MNRNITGAVSCTLTLLYAFYEFALRVYPSFIIKDLMRDLNINATQIGLIGAFYYYSLGFMQFIVGPFLDRTNIKFTLGFSALLCTLTAYTFSISSSLLQLEMTRFFMGLSAAFGFPAMLYQVKEWSSKLHYLMYSSLVIALLALSGTLDNTFFPWALHHLDWRPLATGLSYIGIIVTLLVFLFVRNSEPTKSRKKIKINLKTYCYDLLNALKNKRFLIILFLAFSNFTPVVIIAAFWGITFLIDVHGFSAAQAGWVVATFFSGMTMGLLALSVFSSHFKKNGLIQLLSFIINFFLSLIIIYSSSHNYMAMLTIFFLFGFFLGPPNMLIFHFAKETLPSELTGSALAITNFATILPGMTIQTLVGYLLDTYWSGTMAHGDKVFSAHAFGVAFAIIPVTLFLGILCAYTLRKE